MSASKKILGLIPARGGSERIPGKNIKPLCGKPLIAYSIEAALGSKYIDKVIVFTDSQEIAEVAIKYNAEVPFMRPAEISGAESREIEYYDYVLDKLEQNNGYIPDYIVNLFPTSPFRSSKSIDSAIQLFLRHPEADSLRSVTLCSEHPYKMWLINGDYLIPFVKEADPNLHTLPYKLLPRVYIQNGAIYITKPDTIRKKRSPVGDIVVPFIMDEIESLDINNPLDFELAKVVMENMQRSGK